MFSRKNWMQPLSLDICNYEHIKVNTHLVCVSVHSNRCAFMCISVCIHVYSLYIHLQERRDINMKHEAVTCLNYLTNFNITHPELVTEIM